jgi:gliding motility-associated-like protein
VIDTLLSSNSGGYTVSTYNGEDGSISTEVSGGTAPYSYSWSTGSTATGLSGLTAGIYTLEVTDANGCVASIIIPVTQPDDLIMPTGFSPNSDGANDAFFIRGLDAYPANTFVVLNRWGNVVYDRLNYRNDWLGENIQGQPLPDGTYFVILTVDKGARTLQGYVDLRR